MRTEASFIGRSDGSRRPDWATRFSHFGHVENLVTNLVAGSDLVAHLVAGASGRQSGHGRCGHLRFKVRHNLQFKTSHGEAKSADSDAADKWVEENFVQFDGHAGHDRPHAARLALATASRASSRWQLERASSKMVDDASSAGKVYSRMVVDCE